jgi:luciferase family oxidoreductase group 1
MDRPPVRLGLLDFSWVRAGQSPVQPLLDTVAIAARAETLGYSRYWLGEHHLEGHACGSPQLLAAIVAGATRRIRVGVGAMLLHYWSPLKLAEDFCLLEGLFGRIDLGVGRGRADNLKSHLALLDGRSSKDGMLDQWEYAAKLDDLIGHVRGTIPPEHPHYGAAVIPDVDVMPELWVCGSVNAGAEAARTGTRFCCTLFHGCVAPPVHLQRYRQAFRPSADLPSPHAMIAVAGVCAETEADALAVSEPFPYRHYVPSVVGAPEQCKAQLERFREEYDVDDILMLDIAPERSSRLKSIELLAQAFELRS